MSIPLTINGVTFQYPQEFDTHWGPTLTNWSSAVTTGMLQTSGVNAASLIKSATVNAALTGWLELAKTDTIVWRNNANSADLALGINGSNQLEFNGTPIGASASLTDNHIFVGNVSNQPADVAMSGDATIVASGALTIANGAVTNAKIAAGTGITLTKLAALTASELVVSDGSGFLVSQSSPSLTEIGYVAGVTSAIQTQINTLTSSLGSYLPLTGGTMSGAINMGNHKITALTQGTTTNDAVAFPVDTAQIASNAVTQSNATLSSTFGHTLFSKGTATLTTTGGTVLITYSVDVVNAWQGLNPDFWYTCISQDGTEIAGGFHRFQAVVTSGSGSNITPVSGSTIITPSAGSHTYAINVGFTSTPPADNSASVANVTIIAIELKR